MCRLAVLAPFRDSRTMSAYATRLVVCLGVGAFGSSHACDPEQPLTATAAATSLLEATRALAEASGCRILIAPDLAAMPVSTLARGQSVGAALDQLAIAHELNWRSDDQGVIEIVPASASGQPLHVVDVLEIGADAVKDAPLNLVDAARLPSERGVVIARTRIGSERVADDALHDYTTVMARAPGVYGMAATDAIRGIGASRLQPNQRASMVTLDGVPLPAEAWLFSRPDLSLLRAVDITRSGTGLALAYGAGAGDVALATRMPEAEWHAGLVLADAQALAPRMALTGTGDLGLRGLRTSFGHSRQLAAESLDAAATESDVLEHRQSALRVQWQDDEGRHLLAGSAIDLVNVDLGSALAEGACGRERCPAGAEVLASGAVLGWQWQPTPMVQVNTQAGGSDVRARYLHLDSNGDRIAEDPGYYRLRHADARIDVGGNGPWSWSLGVAQAQRENRTFTPRRFTISAATASSLGMVPAGPGPASLQFTSEINLLTELPQAYAEWRFDDRLRWDGHLGLRWVDATSASEATSHAVQESNCLLVPDRYPPQLRSCSDVARDRSARNALQRQREQRALPTLSLRRRIEETHWLALQWRESVLASDLVSVALSPQGALEHLRTAEFAWHREFERQQFELRVFHHDWRDRVANLDAPFADALSFRSEILGSELEYLLRPGERSEIWASAGVLHARSDLHIDGRDDRAVRGAPPWSLAVGGRHRFVNGLYLGGHFSHAAATWTINPDGGAEAIASRDLLDARVGWRRGRVDLSLWGSNLLDDDYVVDAYGRGAALTPYQAYDRRVGVDLRVEF